MVRPSIKFVVPTNPVSSVTELRHGPVDAFGTAELLTVLGAEAREALTEAAYTATFAAGASLFPESAGADALYVIREGVFHALEPDPPQEPRLVRILGPGDVVDGLLELVGAARPVIVRSVELGVATVIPGEAVDRLVGLHADLRAARDRLHRLQLLSGLSSVFGPIDGALLHALEAEADWIHLQRGEVLWEPGASADGLFFVVSGRVAVLSVRPDGVEELEYEIGRGQTIGAAGFLDGRPRKFRVRAIRDSLLVGYTSAEFERLIARQPQVVRRLTAGLAAQNDSVRRTSGRGVTTVTLMPVSDQASVSKLAERLSVSLSRFGSVLRLDPSRVGQMLTEPGIADAEEGSAEEERLLAFLDACEARHRFVILETTPRGTTWARRCMRLADRLLLVADVRDPSERSHLEHTVTRRANIASSARTSLVLIHLDGTRPPSGTKAWLDERPEVSDHYHVRWDSDADIQRLARVLAGRSVGLVLGGGGARGFAHIGVLRALAENGVPIDAFGGSSMGASVAGQAAMGRPADAIAATTRKVFLEIKPHRGFTLPLLSLVNSRRTEAAGRLCFGDVEIEDLWLPFFCVSSNLTTADVMVHRRGTLWKAALASSSLPGVGTPVLHQGHLLVDGGVLNNLPTDVMRRMGQGTVIASAVSVDESGAFTCERVPTIWEAVRARFGSGGTKDGARFPSILDVVLRASLLHSSFRERANVLAADLTVRPAVQQFGLLEVERIDDIVDAGYREAGITIANWRAQAVEVFS